jgi:hypothetical protein
MLSHCRYADTLQPSKAYEGRQATKVPQPDAFWAYDARKERSGKNVSNS